MPAIRLIARLDIKGPNLIKTVRFEGLRVVGDPRERAMKYYQDGIDEFIFMDIVASLYGRNNLHEIVEYTANNIFVPFTVGGGIRSVEDARRLLRSGADKTAINTAAIARPELIAEMAEQLGSQCVTVSIEAKRVEPGRWECYTDNGREHTGLDVVAWAVKAQSLGAGEILLTSVDQEGTRKGFDLDLIEAVSRAVSVPVVASGGMGSVADLVAVSERADVSGVAMADILHFDRDDVASVRARARAAGAQVRARV